MQGKDPNDNPVVAPTLCKGHQAQLLQHCSIAPDGPWREAIVVAQIAMFQGITTEPDVWARVNGDAHKLHEIIGCPACDKPKLYELLLAAMGNEGWLEGAKQMGELWVLQHARTGRPQ